MKFPLALVGIGNEWRARDLERQPLAAHFAEYGGADGRARSGQISHRDRRIEARPESTRGDRADLLGRGGIGEQWRAFAHRRAAVRLQADAAARRASFKLRENFHRARKPAGARAAV